jgi:glutamate/tyrosine decarboxylase-like PLP-dependent enzyme
MNWNAPGAMFNVTPPSNILGVALNVLTMLLNPNLAEDRSGGLTAYAEQEVVKCLGQLAQWNPEKVTGAACYGGKATNLYASRNAIAHCSAILNGEFDIHNAFYVSSDRGHPCQTEGVALQGIPKENNIVLPCDPDGRMNLVALKAEIENRLEQGQTFLGLTVNAGTTMEYIVDDIPAIVKIRDEAQEKFSLPYKPMIHADAVLGWVWLFAEKFDEVSLHNEEIMPSTISKVKEMYNRVKDVALVDSMGVDFHKLGYTAYQSSFYLTQSLGKSVINDLKFGQLSTYKNTIELSRGAQGVIGALSSLLSFGYEGYVNLITNLLNSVEVARDEFAKHPRLEVLDPGSFGVCNVVTLTHKKPLIDSEVGPEDLRVIHALNDKFFEQMKAKLETGDVSFFTSVSKSYLEPGRNVRYGGFKMYGTSPFLERAALRNFIAEFTRNVDEFYVANKTMFAPPPSKGGKHIIKPDDSFHPIF